MRTDSHNTLTTDSHKCSTPTLLTWGGMLGVCGLFFLEPVPLARRDIFTQLPLIGSFWQAKLDAAARAD
jgi:hypothetical protein